MSTAVESKWLPGPEAARLLGFESTRPVRRLAERGIIGVRTIPGTHPRYLEADVVAIAAESERPGAVTRERRLA